MKIAQLKIGDLLKDTRRGVELVITRIAPWSGGGNGEISYHEVAGDGRISRRCSKTFVEFERLKYLRRVVEARR